jgi:heptosyltransferase I
MSLIAESPPPRLCIIRLSAIGDTCHTVPVVRAIQDAWPDTEITWIVGRVEHGLLSGLEGVHFAVLNKALGWRGYAKLRTQMPTRQFPVLLHMHASSRANIVSLLVSAPIRMGFDRARARDFQYFFCNRHLPARAQQHVMDGLFEFPAALGIPASAPRWDIPVSDADREFAAHQTAGGQPTLVISPCTGHKFRNFRNWRVERYAQIADYVSQRYGARVILTGGSTAVEHEYAQGIGRLAKHKPVDLIGQTSLKQLLALLESASVVLCPDSGPAHMASAVRTPVVGLYATSNRWRTGPYNSQHLVVDKYPEAVATEFGTGVDNIRWGRRVRDPNAMDLITVPDVSAKLELAFAERGIAPLNPA